VCGGSAAAHEQHWMPLLCSCATPHGDARARGRLRRITTPSPLHRQPRTLRQAGAAAVAAGGGAGEAAARAAAGARAAACWARAGACSGTHHTGMVCSSWGEPARP
jgi:hypothetical protein